MKAYYTAAMIGALTLLSGAFVWFAGYSAAAHPLELSGWINVAAGVAFGVATRLRR